MRLECMGFGPLELVTMVSDACDEIYGPTWPARVSAAIGVRDRTLYRWRVSVYRGRRTRRPDPTLFFAVRDHVARYRPMCALVRAFPLGVGADLAPGVLRPSTGPSRTT